MTQDPIRVADYLEHIIQAIQRIKRYTDDMSEVAFLENELVQDASLTPTSRKGKRKDLTPALSAAGLAPKAVVGAVMRKLAHFIYGVIKSGKPFDANYGMPTLDFQDGI